MFIHFSNLLLKHVSNVKNGGASNNSMCLNQGNVFQESVKEYKVIFASGVLTQEKISVLFLENGLIVFILFGFFVDLFDKI